MARTPKPIGLAGGITATSTSVHMASVGIDHIPAVVETNAVPVPVQNLQPIVLAMNDVEKAGSGAEVAIASGVQKITSIAKLSDMDEIGALLGQTLSKAKEYNPEGVHKSGGWFGWLKGKGESLRQKYESVDSTVNRLVGEMDKRVDLFSNRITDLANIGEQNRAYHASLTPEIERLEAGVAYMEANVPAIDPNDPFSSQKVQEWQAVISWARKRADDLVRVQKNAVTQEAIIGMLQQNSRALVSKFKDLKTTTLPALQTGFALYVINIEQGKGADFATGIDDLTNQTMMENAKKLGENTIKVHTALNRSTIDKDTLLFQADAVMKALDDIDRIRSETKTRLANEAPILEQKSRELAARLAQPPK